MSKLLYIRRRVRKLLIRLGLRQSVILPLELSEGHLGGYVLGQAAPGTWCPEIWDWTINELGVNSMLDIGCGLGHSLGYFAQRGVSVAGVDGSPSAIRDGIYPTKVVQHDYTKGPWVPEQSYDLVWSSEFLEHVEEVYVPHFMTTFQRASKYIFVTFAVPGQGGHHHVNLQYAPYWIAHFKMIGFLYDEALTAYAKSLLPASGMRGMQFRDKGLVFKRLDPEDANNPSDDVM